MRLGDKVTIVTGGSRGIGRAIALTFAREGARLAVVDKSRCDEVVAKISEFGGEVIGIQADISNEADVARMVQETKKRYQRIDILVNCAAVNLPVRTVVELTLDEWNWVVGINLTGTFLCCRAVLPTMIAQHYGKIINFSSIGGKQGAAGRTPYRPTKAAIINFTECLSAEVKEFGIDVNAICPATTDTDMIRDITGRPAPPNAIKPEDIAAVALFLASDENRSIVGAAIDAYGRSGRLFTSGR